jgi:small nuclear ribonucleoprotein (snRNP)-like protein
MESGSGLGPHTEAALAHNFLESLLGKTLRITVPDGRLFSGTFRCTDNESNGKLTHDARRTPKTDVVTSRSMC